MRRHRLRFGVVALALLAGSAAAVPAPASAVVVTRGDGAGRTITLDVPAGTNVDAIAGLLRRALHGDEIEEVTLRVAGGATLARVCGGRYVSCYVPGRWRDGAEILLPRSRATARDVVLHEYAHHLDATYGLTGWHRWREPSARRWWAARRIGNRLARGEVSDDYSRGWQRSIGEIFAEDYVQLHARAKYAIRWLPLPSRAVRVALRLDVREAFADADWR